MTTLTAEQALALFDVLKAVTEAIKGTGKQGLPNGHLYAQVMGSVSLDAYNSIIAMIKKAGLIKEEFNVLYYIGPEN